MIPWEIIPPLKLQDLTQYQIDGANKTRFGTTTFQVSMNQNSWDRLPEDIQKIFMDASDEAWVREVGNIWSSSDDVGIGLAIKAGNTHIVLTEQETEAFKKVLEPVVDRWINEVVELGIDGSSGGQGAQADRQVQSVVHYQSRPIKMPAHNKGLDLLLALIKAWALIGGLLLLIASLITATLSAGQY